MLDSARYRTFLAMELGVSVQSVEAMVLGGHGDDMVPVRSYCQRRRRAGREVSSTPERLEEIEKRTRKGGGEIVNLMKTVVLLRGRRRAVQMVEAYLLDRKQVLPCAAYLEGEYGVKGFFVGVPVVIGAGGVERVIEIALTAAEKKPFDSSVEHVRELVEAMDKVLPADSRANRGREVYSWLRIAAHGCTGMAMRRRRAAMDRDQRHLVLRRLHSLTGIVPIGAFLFFHIF